MIKYCRFPITSDGKVQVELKDSKDLTNIASMQVVDVVIVQPKFKLNETMVFNGYRIDFIGDYTIDEITNIINANRTRIPDCIRTHNGAISIFVWSNIKFSSESRISRLLGFTNDEYTENKKWVNAEAKLDLCVNYYNVMYNKVQVGIVSESKVIDFQRFDIDKTKSKMRIRNDDGSKLKCDGGHLLCKLFMRETV